MQPHSCLFCQQYIPCHNHVLHTVGNPFYSQFFCLLSGIHHSAFHHGNVFAMCKNRESVFFCQAHSLSVQGCRHHRLAILAYCMAARFSHPLYICQFFSLFSLCDSPKLNHMYRRFHLCPSVQLFHHFLCICNGCCIWHGAERRDSSVCRSPSTGPQCFFIGQPGIAQMYVEVYKTRHNITARGINNPVGRYRKILFHFHDQTSLYEHITDIV